MDTCVVPEDGKFLTWVLLTNELDKLRSMIAIIIFVLCEAYEITSDKTHGSHHNGSFASVL